MSAQKFWTLDTIPLDSKRAIRMTFAAIRSRKVAHWTPEGTKALAALYPYVREWAKRQR